MGKEREGGGTGEEERGEEGRNGEGEERERREEEITRGGLEQ